jgi:hypothetical protein
LSTAFLSSVAGYFWQMATRVPPSEIFPGEPDQYSGLKANQAEHRSKMKHDRVELLFLHSPQPR